LSSVTPLRALASTCWFNVPTADLPAGRGGKSLEVMISIPELLRDHRQAAEHG
jgi:hypothetical protein